ncbi:MAG: hypothetical protein HC860_13600 [Alkalinema sp. RU_4_3]|nr:hypothetical protein [Alkalinema sp. RU_4_3]
MVSLDLAVALIVQNMASNQTPKRRPPQQDSSASQSPKPKRRKGKVIEIRYTYGDNDVWFRVTPKFLAAATTTALTALLGLSTVNSALQALQQSPALPASQRIVENPEE